MMNFESMSDESKKYRVYWNSNGYTTYYWVDSLEDAKLVIEVLTKREVADETVIWNTQGLEILSQEDGEWEEWYSDDGLDIHEYFDEVEVE